MIGRLSPNLDEPPDHRVHGCSDALPPEHSIPDHVEQVIRKTSCEKPCLIRCEAIATRLIPPEGVLPLFDPVFNLSSTTVNRNYLACFNIRFSHNETDTREEFTHTPFDFKDNPSRFIPFLRLVTQLDHPHLHSALWRPAASSGV